MSGTPPRSVAFSMRPGGTATPTAVADQPEPDADPELPPDARISLADDPAARAVRRVLDDLDRDLVGLAPVKTRTREIAALLTVERARARFGMSASRPSLHMSFTGPPGTGKTTVALRMAAMLHALGYLKYPRVHAVTRDDLVGQFIGHTAPRTKEALAKAAGGVLFIDEAYYLYRSENERDYGQEAIEILLQEMESQRGNLVVIFAGYEDRMEEFFSSNPGLSSRVSHHVEFTNYSLDELQRIADLMLAREEYRLSPEAKDAFAGYLELRMAQPRFANARSVRNALERARFRQSNRLVLEGGTVGRDELMTITATDILASRVFSGSEDPSAPSSSRRAPSHPA